MKNIFHGINSRVDEAKNQISNLEYKEAKNPNQNRRFHPQTPGENEFDTPVYILM